MPVSSALQFFQTLNTYSRLYPNKQAEVAQQLENLINGTTVPDTIIKKEKELLRALLIQFCKLEFLDAYNMRKKLNSILKIVLSFTAIL